MIHSRVLSLDGNSRGNDYDMPPIATSMLSPAGKFQDGRKQQRFVTGTRSVRANTNARPFHIDDTKEARQASNDATFRKTGLSVGLVIGTMKPAPFGHNFYKSPKADSKYRISVGNATLTERRKNFADLEAKNVNHIPGPKYVRHTDWRENIKGNIGKFLKKPRKTFTDEIMEYEKKTPAPSKFDNKEALKKLIKTPGNYLL